MIEGTMDGLAISWPDLYVFFALAPTHSTSEEGNALICMYELLDSACLAFFCSFFRWVHTYPSVVPLHFAIVTSCCCVRCARI